VPVDNDESNVESDFFIFPKESKRKRVSRMLMHKLNTVWFRYLVRNFSRAIYEIDNLETGAIEKNVAYSQYSVNYGLTYIIYMELHLGDNTEENLDGLVEMFRDTENHLHSTLINRQPSYLANYLRH
jgi:hypothetical protein